MKISGYSYELTISDEITTPHHPFEVCHANIVD